MIFTSVKQTSAMAWPRSLPHLRATSVTSRLWKVETGRMWFELTEVEQSTHLWGCQGYGVGVERPCVLCSQLATVSLAQPASFFILG